MIFNPASYPPKINGANYNALLANLQAQNCLKLYSSVVDGVTYYYAGKGGKILYGGPDVAGGVNGLYESSVRQAAINACVNGGVINIRAGTYYPTSSVLIPPSTHDLTINCEKGAKIVYPNNASEFHVFYTPNTGSDTYQRISIDGLEVDGTLNGVTTPASYEATDLLMPIYINNCSNLTVQNCYFHDYWGFAVCLHYSTVSNPYSGAWILNNRFYNAGKTGKAFHSGGGVYSSNADTHMKGNILDTFYGTGLCLDEKNGWINENTLQNLLGGGTDDFAICTGYGANKVVIDSNQIYNVYRRAIANKIGGATACPYHTVTKNIIDSAHGPFAAIGLSDTGHIVSDNTIVDWGSLTSESWADGVQIELAGNALIKTNHILSVLRNGITVYGAAMVQGNYSKGTQCGCVFSGNNAASKGPVSNNYFDGAFASIYFYQVNNAITARNNELATAPLTSESDNITLEDNFGY